MDNFNRQQVMASICVMEAFDEMTLHGNAESKTKAELLISRYREQNGSYELRDRAIEVGVMVDRIWDRLNEEFSDDDAMFTAWGAYDFEFIPDVLQMAPFTKSGHWEVPKEEELYEEIRDQTKEKLAVARAVDDIKNPRPITS